MKHYKRTSGLCQVKKKPSRKLRKAMENFLHRYGQDTRAEARVQLVNVLWSMTDETRPLHKGRQNKIRFGVSTKLTAAPWRVGSDFVVATCYRGRYVTKKRPSMTDQVS